MASVQIRFASKSSHILTPYNRVQKLETEIEIFPVYDHRAVRRCPAVRRSQDWAQGGSIYAEDAPGRGAGLCGLIAVVRGWS
jgi:hypothetical protein